MGLSGREGSVTTKDCLAICMALTRLKSERSRRLVASSMDSVTMLGRVLALQFLRFI